MPRAFLLLIALLFTLVACSETSQQPPQTATPGARLELTDDSYTLDGTTLNVSAESSVLANDTLPKTFELSLSIEPEYGTLVLRGDGSFIYQASGAATPDTFSYRVTSAGKEADAEVALVPASNPAAPDAPAPENPTPSNPNPSEPNNPAPKEPAPRCPLTLKTGQAFECQFAAGSTLGDAPEGMVLHSRSGLLRWTPTFAQAKDHTFSVTTTTEQLTLTVAVTAGSADPAGIYVSPSGDDAATGTASTPFKTLQHAVDNVAAGTTIYVRGGTYYNANYGKKSGRTKDGSRVAKVTTTGTAAAPLVLRAYGNEFVKLVSDENGLLFSGVAYWTVDGLELEGNAQTVTYQNVMDNWWEDSYDPTTGRGISNQKSRHLTVQNSVIHDFPGAGVGSNGADYVTVKNNLIHNNGWWSTAGTHGVANSYLTGATGASDDKLILTGNLIFGNQSLIISHVFSKGKVALAVDEGNGLHAQNNRRTLVGKARVENNLLLFNGKAGFGINTMDDITVRNNAFYHNARVVGSAGELTVQSSRAADISNNLFAPASGRPTIKDFQKAYTNVGKNATSGAQADLPATVQQLAAVFVNPAALDFRAAAGVPSGMGVPEADLNRMFAQAAAYGVEIVSPKQTVDDTYLLQMKQTIFDSWPAKHASLILDDRDTKTEYSYAERCYFPATPPENPSCP